MKASTARASPIRPPRFAAPFDVHGEDGSNETMDWTAQIAPSYFNNRKVSIYGGSNEIQRNIITKAVLGL
jgi:alkylation response protein AidB-like acyl-CoA dehydrogenase